MSSLEKYVEKVKKETEGFSSMEKLRYIYWDLGSKFAFDLDFSFGNSKIRKQIYDHSRSEDNLNRCLENNTAICKSIAYIFSYVMKELGVNIESVIDEEDFRKYPHIYNVLITEDGRKYRFDLQEDMRNIKAQLRTQYFGIPIEEEQELGCNKIALGHHFDDVIETILMGMLYGAQMQTMMPKLHSTYHEGMELIRPLYYVKEADIIKWRERNDLHFIQCACRFTEHCTMCDNGGGGSKREEMKKLLKQLRSVYDKVDMNIYNSTKNVNLNTLISYVKDGEVHHFMYDYDKKKEKNSPRE